MYKFMERINNKNNYLLVIIKKTISYNIGDKRSFRSVAEKIWENCEPSNFPFIPCYTRVSGTEWSESAASLLAFVGVRRYLLAIQI